MDANEYATLYNSLQNKTDIEILSREKGLPKELLTVILTQKIVRETKRRYYTIKNKSQELCEQWKKGKTFQEISKEQNFPPALLTSILMQHMGTSKKKFRSHLAEPATIENPRMRKELHEAIRNELVYSPEGTRIQWERGKDVESNVKTWLKKMKLRFKTEVDLRQLHPKTPDFLLDTHLPMNGKWVKWIECKASFGDQAEVRRDYGKQLTHYSSMFGDGIVVYWYGYIEEAKKELNDRILMVDANFFNRDMI